jgi:cytochrome c553
MRTLIWLLLFAFAPSASFGANMPDWAFPVPDKVQPSIKLETQPKTISGSTRAFTQAQIDDLKNPPDWFSDMHPLMPDVVGHGTATFACASCHLPTGTGHDESAYLAGLPAAYLARQMADFKSGTRKGFGPMADIAHALDQTDFDIAAAYFASIGARPWVRVVETDMVPKTYVNLSSMRLALPDGGSEPIGSRIVELPENEIAAVARDPRSGFVAYAPKGSIDRGKTLVTTGGGETTACVICHGSALKGVGAAPAIAGRHTGYIARQLYFFQNGSRSGPSEALMHNVVQKLTTDEMLAIAAYVASVEP